MNEDPTPASSASSETVTKTYSELPTQDSSFIGISVRAWLAVLLVATVCFTQAAAVVAVLYDAVKTGDFGKVGTFLNIGEPMYSMSVAALAFYFGQKSTKP